MNAYPYPGYAGGYDSGDASGGYGGGEALSSGGDHGLDAGSSVSAHDFQPQVEHHQAEEHVHTETIEKTKPVHVQVVKKIGVPVCFKFSNLKSSL